MTDRMPKIDFLDPNLQNFDLHGAISVPNQSEQEYTERHTLDGATSLKNIPKLGFTPASDDGILESAKEPRPAREGQQLFKGLKLQQQFND